MSDSSTPTYVLVHGGSHGAWFWDDTIADLAARGRTAHAIDLPGRDGDPRVTLDQYVDAIGAAVDAVIAGTGEPPVLVAHSMGGVSVAQFAERRPGDVRSIIYVAAVVPLDGASGLERLGEGGSDSVLLRDGSLVPSADGGSVTVNEAIAVEAFYGRTDPAVAAAAVPRLNAEPVGPLATPLSLGEGFASVRSSWIAGTEDRTVPYALQQTEAADIGATLETLEADHSPNLSARSAFADLLVRLA